MLSLGLITQLPNQLFLATFQEKLTLENITKYLVEGLIVAFVGYFIPKAKVSFVTMMTVTIAVALSLFILDIVVPAMGQGTRLGIGLAIGYNLINKIPRLGNVI
jgi:hypothetical protein